ncbi:MAG TPA: diacylglycerol kinase family protein [Thermoanaerobaculia bacterium]|nr:diacylglycerol kinase family protein [Thermoanaerobaculia bacterium]
MRTIVIVNRGAGGGRGCRVWERTAEAEPLLDGAGVIARASAEEALAELDALLDGRAGSEGGGLSGIDRLLVVGGDGTLSRVADHLLARAGGRPVEVPLGLVPAGTGSDLAAALGVPRDPAKALRHALDPARGARPRPIDALEMTGPGGRRRFGVNVVSAGVSGEVDQAIAVLPKRGATTYLKATLGALARYRPFPCRIAVDGEPWHEGDLLLLAVANGPTFGRGMKIAPDAELDDGLADLVLVPRLPAVQVPIQLPRLYLGKHLTSRYVHFRRGRTLHFEPLADMPPFDVDGDTWPGGPVQIQVRPKALRILA